MTEIKIWDTTQIKRMAMKSVIQAVKDFAFPVYMEDVERRFLKLDKSNPCYEENVKALFTRERKKIIKELNGDFMILLTNGLSSETAVKLSAILKDKTGKLLEELQKNIKSCDFREE